MTNKKNVMHLGTFKFSYNKLQKKNWKIHLHVKVFFGTNDLQSFSKVIPLASSYMF